MKKRLALICIMLLSMFAFFACKEDPYEKLKIQAYTTDNQVISTIDMMIEDKGVIGAPQYELNPYKFHVMVTGYKDKRPNVEISGGEGVVSIDAKFISEEVVEVTLTPLDAEKTDPFVLTARTTEGNKSVDINVRIDLKINNFTYNESNLKVVAKGGEINLNDLEKYLNFTPQYTTQKHIKFEIVTPVSGEIPNHPGNYIYEGETPYAEIVDGVLKTFETTDKSNPVVYPQKVPSLTPEDTYQCITLKASYVGANASDVAITDKYIDIEVVEDCSDIKLYMNYEKNTNEESSEIEGAFCLNKNDFGEYDIVLLDPQYKYGVVYPTYYVERDILFNFGYAAAGYDPDDYRVVSSQVLDSDKKPITLTSVKGENVENNQFHIIAEKAGNYTHVFRIEHKDYPDIINEEVIVNFYVKDLPMDVLVNNDAVKDSYTVYDYYSKNSYGAKFNIDLNNNNGNFNYFVFLMDKSHSEFVKLYRGGNYTEQVKGAMDNVNGVSSIVSTVEGKEIAHFSNKESFYLKHEFETLPDEDNPVIMGIAIDFTIAADSYTDDIKNDYFITTVFIPFMTTLKIENSVKDIEFTQYNYMLDLTNPDLTNNIHDEHGVELFKLPQGHTRDSVFASNGITYDHSLIDIYDVEVDGITKFYMKCNTNYSCGKTNISVKTKNGIEKTVSVETFIPTAYANLNPDGGEIPMSIWVDGNKVLYYISDINRDDDDSDSNPHDEYYYLYKNTEIWDETTTYNTLDSLFLLLGTKTEIRFFDYVLTYDGENKVAIPIDITSRVKIEFNYKNFVAYSNGVITATKTTEEMENDPLMMMVTYSAGYMSVDDEGNETYTIFTKQQKIKLYVYIPLQGVNVETEKDVTVYVDDSLGVYSKSLSSHTTISDFIPKEDKLGIAWNSRDIWKNATVMEDLPVSLFYKYNIHAPVLVNNVPLTIPTFSGNPGIQILYSDIFEDVTTADNAYVLVIKSRISESLKTWLLASENNGGGGYSNEDIDYIIKNYIFCHDITLRVNVYIRQFFKLQNINEVNISAAYASKINGYTLDVVDDGIYFENRSNNTTMTATVDYRIDDGVSAPDKEFHILNANNSIFSASVKMGLSKNEGTIYITGLNTFGEEYLRITPRDNIKSIDGNGDYTFFNDDLVQSFRVEIANGSIEAPFEIRTPADFVAMQADIDRGNYAYYKVTRNINLANIEVQSIDFLSQDSSFNLSGKHVYYRNNREFINYSSLYNMTIKKEITDLSDFVDVGLFGKLNNKVTISNLNIINANINLTIKNPTGLKDKLYVGILAGRSEGAKIYNSSANGTIKITNSSTIINNIFVGGLVGDIDATTSINGLPGSYVSGLGNTAYNVNVLIMINDNGTQNVVAGGLVGKSAGKIADMSIVSTIKLQNVKNSSVGGAIGSASNSVENIKIYPKIVLEDNSSNNILGGAIAEGNGNFKHIQVYFTHDTRISSWKDNCGIYVGNTPTSTTVGGLIGRSTGGSLEYSYLRSFHQKISSAYRGDICVLSEDINNTIGGIVGVVDGLSLSSSYFDGNIVASNNKALLFGKLNNASSITNCYGIGGLYELDGTYVDSLIGDLSFGLVANAVFTEHHKVTQDGKVYYKQPIDNFTNVYGVVNDSLLYVVENNSLVLSQLNYYKPADISTLFNNLGYELKVKEEDVDNNTKWIWADGVNIVKSYSFPILMNNDLKALYDLLPESIEINRIAESHGLYALSNLDSDKVQLLMYVNRKKVDENNYTVKDDYYEISVEDNGIINIKLNGGSTLFSTMLSINGDITIEAESIGNSEVVALDGWKIYPKNQGVAVVTIASLLDNSISLKLEIKVVDGITDLILYNSQSSNQIECDKYDVSIPLDNIIYVDEETSFTIKNSNELDEIRYNSGSTIYKLEIISSNIVTPNDVVIYINGNEYLVGEILILYNNNFVLSGIKEGDIFIDITPAVLLDGINNTEEYYLLDDLKSSYKFRSCYKTKAISVSDKLEGLSFSVSTEFSIEMHSYLDETLLVMIGNSYRQDISIRNIIDGDSAFNISVAPSDSRYNNIAIINGIIIDYELVNIEFTSMSVEQSDFPNLHKITLNAIARLNIEYYRQYAENYDLNTLKYVFNLIPATNYINDTIIDHKIADSLEISVAPIELKNVAINYYPKGETLTNKMEGSFNTSTENDSNVIVPGRYGLLKLTLEEEFTDSSYITLTLDEKYADYIELWQVAGDVKTELENDTENNYFDYSEISSSTIFRTSSSGQKEYGLKLTKLSLNYLDTTYFNKTYYIKVFMTRDYALLNAKDVIFNVTSYTQTLTDGLIVKEIASKSLAISELPTISVKVDNLTSANLGIGTKKPLDIVVKGEEITTIDIIGAEKDGLLILDDNDQIVNVLDVAYINSGRKYYIYADITNIDSYKLKNYEIEFRSSQKVHGIIENTSTKIDIYVVDLEIEKVSLNGSVGGLVVVKHGGEYIISVDMSYRKPVAISGNKNVINELDSKIQEKVNELELSMVGCYKNPLDLRYLHYINGNTIYSSVKADTKLKYVALRESVVNGLKFYVLKGIAINSIDTAVSLRLVMPYGYVDGILEHKVTLEGTTFEVDFEMVVEDSSTYDHPMPIENQEQLELALKTAPGENQKNANYILLNNIVLKNWIPVDAVCTSLDGNGYTITIESFNLAGYKGQEKANIGLCSTVGENTLLKNLIIDISPLLVDESTVLRDVELLKNSTINNYNYNSNINLAYIKEVNFGIVAGINNGSITNAKVINLKNQGLQYIHVLTSLGYVDKKFVTTNIGGIVGINEDKGAITNSYIGLDVNKMQYTEIDIIDPITGDPAKEIMSNSQIAFVEDPSIQLENNEQDTLSYDIPTYGFTIAGGNILGGVVAINDGIIANSYAKGLGLHNTYFAVEDSKTGGFVAVNNNVISGAFVEGARSEMHRAVEDDFVVESRGHIGGFVYQNTSLIENSYSNVYLVNRSSFIGGFVYNNSGTVKNAYTTTINRNNLAYGQFTGVSPIANDENDDDTNYVATTILNTGTYVNAYYIVLDGEQENKNEDAAPIINVNSPVDEKITWQGFSFSALQDVDGIWKIIDGSTPKLTATTVDTLSFRKLESKSDSNEVGNTGAVYNYIYEGNALGSENNPLVINSSDVFAEMIIENGITIDGVRVFGADRGSDNILSKMNSVRHVRLVNNLDFNNKPIAPVKLNSTNPESPEYLLYQTVFAGVLDGNGMSINNLNISVNANNSAAAYSADNFGLFSQIGYYIEGDDLSQAVIKNLNITVKTYNDGNINNIGILAGTIVNSNIINVHVDGGNLPISGNYTAGGLAGIIKSEGKAIVLQDITVTNINVMATRTSLGGDIFDKSDTTEGSIYKQFTIKNSQSTNSVKASFKSLYNYGSTQWDNIKAVCYAGGIAGVIYADNYDGSIINMDNSYSGYKTETKANGGVSSSIPTTSTINNIVYEGSLSIGYSDNAGGLFGYVGENTIIKNSHFVLSNSQSIKANNYAGGLIGENHGVIDECTIAFDTKTQSDLDKNIIENDRKHSEYYLFDARDLTVAVGGIAGYSSNGVIIDSYAKVNIIKDNAFIAGGVIGYAENYNYLGYVYNTGAVMGKEVVGGVVGMQVNGYTNTSGQYSVDENKELAMYNVVSLADWGATIHNIRDTVTRRLYNNQKDLYENSEFSIKMPEIGNQMIANDSGNKYNSKTKAYVIGSVIGSLKNVSDETNFKYEDFADYEKVVRDRVYSTTLGMFYTDNKVISQRRQDDYFKTPYEFVDDANNKHNLYSFHIAYDNTGYYFNKVFTSQEYVQQLLGQYYFLDGNASIHYNNIFRYNCDIRYGVRDVETSFATNELVWIVDNNLPEFSKGLYSSVETITNLAEWTEAVTSNSSGKTYNIEPESSNAITIDTDASAPKIIMYPKTLSDTYIGVDNPSIKFNVTGNNFGSIFNSISGATLSNITFDITVSGVNINTANKIYGLFANTIENSSITNCTFNISLTSAFNINKNALGLLFGEMRNTIFKNNNVTLNINSAITLGDEVNNFGLLTSLANNCTINNNTFTAPNNITLSINSAINVGGVVGVLNNSTFTNNIFNSVFVVTDSTDDSINFGGFIGVSNNSNINTLSANNVSYTLNNSKENKDVNVSNIVGAAFATKINNITSDKSLTISAENCQTKSISVGAIVGNAESSVTIRNSNNIGTVSATAKTNNLSVGSVVGSGSGITLDSVYSRGEIVANNVYEGEYSNRDGKVNAVYSETNVGGLIGYSDGYTNIQDVYSIAKLNLTTKDKLSVLGRAGGLVGYNGGNIEISRFTALNDFVVNNVTTSEVYVSGVVGLNKGLFTGYYGYSYIELPKQTGVKTASITNNSISSNTTNVYYAQEFVSNDYESDRNFIAYAMADLYIIDSYVDNPISRQSSIYELSKSDGFEIMKSYGKVALPLPKGLVLPTNSSFKTGDSRFAPSYESSNIRDYNVVLFDITLALTELNGIISGRSVAGGKVTVTFGGDKNATETKFFVTTNNGILSNLYINFNDNESGINSATNTALAKTNNGLITNVYAYGLTDNNYPIAKINNGRIYQSATSVVHASTSETVALFGLVETNNATIFDCYSSSFGYSVSREYKTSVYGFANENTGTISNSFYFINDWMIDDNNMKGFAQTNTGKITNCIKGANPKFASYITTIYTTENDHAQIRGMKDISNQIDVILKLGTATGLSNISTYIQSATYAQSNDLLSMNFDYELKFYSEESSQYNYIRISDGNKFKNYINGLKNGLIPANTIIIIDNSFDVNEEIQTITLSKNSAIIGVSYYNSNGKNWVDRPEINFKNIVRNTAFIDVNNGLIGGLVLSGIKIENENPYLSSFAPINKNSSTGIMFNLYIRNSITDKSSITIGLLKENNGYVYDVSHATDIYARKMYFETCYNNLYGKSYKFKWDILIVNGRQTS